MTKKDYYEVLNLPRSASEKEIKAAYRRLARQYHPDVNKGDKAAEEKFKEIAEAFAVLSDPEKKARYDRGGHQAFGPGFDPFAGFDFQAAGFDLTDLLGNLFGGFGGRGQRTMRPRKGSDLRMELRLPFLDAVRGTTLDLKVPRLDRGGRREEDRVTVRIPPAVDDGATLRLAGKGDAGQAGGPAGDLYLTLRVERHPLFRREGRDLLCDVAIGLARSALGGTVPVETLEGPATITVPPGTRSGQKFRLRGKGVPSANGRPAGDLFAVIQIVPPKKLDARSKRLLEEFRELNPE